MLNYLCNHVRVLLQKVIKSNIKGDYIETGVWQGGSSVFARAVITILGKEKNRVSMFVTLLRPSARRQGA